MRCLRWKVKGQSCGCLLTADVSKRDVEACVLSVFLMNREKDKNSRHGHLCMRETKRTRLKENDNYQNKAAHTFTESDKQIRRSPGCVCWGEPHDPRVLPLHISIFIDPLKTQRHQTHHNSGLQRTFTPHTYRDMQTHTRKKKRHLLCKPQCLLRAKLEHRLGNNSRLNHHRWPRKKILPAWKIKHISGFKVQKQTFSNTNITLYTQSMFFM